VICGRQTRGARARETKGKKKEKKNTLYPRPQRIGSLPQVGGWGKHLLPGGKRLHAGPNAPVSAPKGRLRVLLSNPENKVRKGPPPPSSRENTPLCSSRGYTLFHPTKKRTKEKERSAGKSMKIWGTPSCVSGDAWRISPANTDREKLKGVHLTKAPRSLERIHKKMSCSIPPTTWPR